MNLEKPRGKQPNMVVIFADDIGYGDFGCYNSDSKIPTPHIDRLAAEGMCFHDAHSASAVCTPSRYSLMTGRYCWRSELKRGVLYGYEPPLIEPDRLTVASLLKEAGYHTGCIGKWHLGLGYSTRPDRYVDFGRHLPWSNAARELDEAIDFCAPIEGGPLDLGFDTFFGTSGCSTCQPPYGFIDGRHFVEAPSVYDDDPPFTGRAGIKAPSWDHKEADPTFARKAVEYIEARADEDAPFFLYLAPSAAHEPCTDEVTPEFARGKSDAGPRGDLVWLFDWMVGQVMDALDRTGQAESTLIMISSDNGALAGDRVKEGDGVVWRTYDHASCGDLRGYKAHIWEGGHREPLVARWPGRVAAGSSCDSLCCLTDLIATCADIVGSTLPAGAADDSVSLLPALLGKQDATPSGRTVVHHSGTGVFAVRQDDWKAVFGTTGSGGWPPPRGAQAEAGTRGQLYNLADDPHEEHNLWDERPGVVVRLGRELDQCKATRALQQ